MSVTGLRFLACLMTVCANIPISSAIAMDFTLTRELGIEADGHVFPDIVAIAASGVIEDGDSAKLAEVLPSAERDQFGNVRVYLD
ncbi:hypothetical protein FJW07_29925, partial [Mesorhizobium sp. B3-1-9]|uniref:hypothetical protein n=1 Tax=Mesorhizobium sp. B3-1-9 TaxID=2589892 RepID=UPI00112B2557